MRRTLLMMVLICVMVIALDCLVALGLTWAQNGNRLGSLVQYFDYGRSVPGKLKNWVATPGEPGNLFNTAWRSDVIAASDAAFADETNPDAPRLRSYGMSFVNHILEAATRQRPDIHWDNHSGPAAPPNFTFAIFLDDRHNRRPGDTVVLGILSSSVPGMAALSNRSWNFEQPAPFSYPIFQPEGEQGLRRIEPLVNSAAAERNALQGGNADWYAQLHREDAFVSPITFGGQILDQSPFLRLVRRSLAKTHVDKVRQAVQSGQDYPYADALQRMIREFANTARADGQYPIVMLIQSGNPQDVNLLPRLQPMLAAENIPYFATAEHFNPRNPAGFIPDGHYKPEIDAAFGTAFLNMLPE